MALQPKWIRKTSDVEEHMMKMSQDGQLLVAYRLSVSTRRPLEREDVEQALSHLYRKSPNLRSCFAMKDGELWFKEMETVTLDFEVTSADVDDVTDYMHSQGYALDGPLWRVRLLPVPSPRYQPHNLSSFHEDLQTTFPHCYHVVFGFSHAIGDGHSFIRICVAFANILDCVLSGEEVDEEQIGFWDINEEYLHKTEESLTKINADEKLREKVIYMVNEGKPDSSLLDHVLTPCEEGPKKTVLYNQTLDEPTTTRLVEKCRAQKVTLSSLMAAVGNLAFVDMLMEKGVVGNSYSISNSHLINMRRVWPKGTTEKAFGCYISMSSRQFYETPQTVDEEKFWEYVKYVHERFYNQLLDENFMEFMSFTMWCLANRKLEYVIRDLTYNTRGDLTSKLGETKEITVTNLLSSTSIHKIGIPWDHVFGTVRGRLTHTIKYNTSMISETTAVKYSDLVYARLLRAAGPWEEPLSM